MRTIQIHPLSLAVGAIAVSAAFLLTAQTTPPAQTTWPPPKSMILNTFEQSIAVTVPTGGTFPVLTVPSDRWLTITGAFANTSIGTGLPLWAESTAPGTLIAKGIAQVGSGHFTPPECGGPIGWTFAPGSSVVIWNRDPGPGGTVGPLTITEYSLVGYYSRN